MFKFLFGSKNLRKKAKRDYENFKWRTYEFPEYEPTFEQLPFELRKAWELKVMYQERVGGR